MTLNDYCVRVYPKDEGIFKTHVDQHAFGTVGRLFAVLCTSMMLMLVEKLNFQIGT